MMKVLVTFDLENAKAADYDRAYQFLGELGLEPAAQDILFPSTVVVGTWYPQQHDSVTIRDTLWGAMRENGIPVSRLLVAEYKSLAWFGRKL